VSTVGRSRADRSVQYLYLNPNLVAIVTESTDPLRRESPGLKWTIPVGVTCIL